jgi:hypothetical protein
MDYGSAHLTICVSPSGGVKFYPEGDAAQLVRGLELVVRAFTERPETIRCAAGACDGTCPHGERPQTLQ